MTRNKNILKFCKANRILNTYQSFESASPPLKLEVCMEMVKKRQYMIFFNLVCIATIE